MHRWLPLLLLPINALAAAPRGVAPSLAPRYVPKREGSRDVWQCLDTSQTIPWSAVNDDYCDCADGSDEPGTGACPNTTFYCANVGHVGQHIPGSRVRDGLCEPECCDGSDEDAGVCPNVCKEIGEAYREREKAARKLRKTGSKIRSSYIAFAQKEKKRIEGEIAKAAQEIAAQEKEVAHLKDIAERTESLSAAAMEHKKSSPLYISLQTHVTALKSLQLEHKKHLEREKALEDILDALRTGYNPNYQDMAVLNAVRGYEYHAGLPHINDVGKDKEEEDEPAEANSEEEGTDEEEEQGDSDLWSASQLESDLDGLLKTDHESLLIEHDKHIGAPAATSSLLYDITAYLPDALVPQYEALRDGLVSWLGIFGFSHSAADQAADTSLANKAWRDAEKELEYSQKLQQDTEEELSRLFNAEWYGTDGEWKKLDKTCIEKDVGDYIYEVCLFDEARQKPTKGGSTFSLGTFHSWNTIAPVGTPEYYSKQHYTGGARCWNGPLRSVTLVMSCGTENVLLSVAEPEKCEYEFKVTSPALCLPLTEAEKREEL